MTDAGASLTIDLSVPTDGSDTGSSRSPDRTAPAATATPVQAGVRDYIELTKPRIAMLLSITCVCSMIVAEQGWPGIGLVALTVFGLVLSSGGASAINHAYDMDIDQRMTRTASRPIARGAVSPRAGYLFGVALMAAGFLLLATQVNLLTAVWAFAGGAFYAVGYTMVLKRTTAQNIVIGGAAGAIPPLVGWAAVTGGVALMPVLLFGIIFMWTPPHFWALALLISDEYERAGVPMLPSVAGATATARQIVAYSVGLVVISVLPVFTGDAGLLYLVIALAAGARFLVLAVQLLQAVQRAGYGIDPDIQRLHARRLFLYSMAYLAVVFFGLVVDALIR